MMATTERSITSYIGDYELPEGWQVVTINDLFLIQQGKALSAAARTASDRFPFLRTSNVLWGRLDLNTIDNMGMSAVERKRLKLLPGDLLVCEGGDIGRCAVWNEELSECYYQNHIHRLRPKDSRAVSAFYAYWLRLAFMRLGVYEGAGTKTTIANLSRGRLSALQIPLPLRDEQLKIAEMLSTIQRSKELTDQELAMAKGVRSSFLATLLRHTKQSGDDDLQITEYGPLPAHWQMLPLEQICDLVVDCPHTTPHFLEEGVLVLRNFNIRDGEINLDRASYTSEDEYVVRTARARPLEGDIVFSREAPVGEACIIPPNTKLSLGQRTMLLRGKEEIILSEYLLGTLYTPELQAFMRLRSTGVTAPHLNVADVRRMLIPVPPLNEQRQAVRALKAMRKSVQTRRKVAFYLEHLFNGTLNLLMVGSK